MHFCNSDACVCRPLILSTCTGLITSRDLRKSFVLYSTISGAGSGFDSSPIASAACESNVPISYFNHNNSYNNNNNNNNNNNGIACIIGILRMQFRYLLLHKLRSIKIILCLL